MAQATLRAIPCGGLRVEVGLPLMASALFLPLGGWALRGTINAVVRVTIVVLSILVNIVAVALRWLLSHSTHSTHCAQLLHKLTLAEAVKAVDVLPLCHLLLRREGPQTQGTQRKGNSKLRHVRIGQMWVQQLAEEDGV